MRLGSLFGTVIRFTSFVLAVTIYYPPGRQQALSATDTAAAANYTGAAAYNPTVLNPPPVPPGLTTQFNIQLQNGGTPGVSITQEGSFVGFSIEMSVVNQVLGKNSSVIQVPFLNLMANLQQRAGAIKIRVGGNTQETATLVESTPDGRILEKDILGVSNPTQTPPLIFTPDVLYMMRNISSFVNARWFLGIPFNDTTNFRLDIVNRGQAILGDYLIGIQAGNEPDLYVRHGHRPPSYGPFDYVGEIYNLLSALAGPEHDINRQLLIGPNIATGDWTPEDVWNTGFVDTFSQNLKYLAVENYPADNCFAQFGIGRPVDVQAEFPNYLSHNAGKLVINKYLNSTAYAQTKGKRMLMFETNTASCGGFPGISDAFGAGLWGLDYSLQMAYSNFSGALMHVGGQNVFYNPFTPPPTNQTTFHQWTIGPIYYVALIMAEVLGPSNKSQVLDLKANSDNIYTPAYAIYEDGNPVRVALFNFVTDQSGASTLNVGISVGNGHGGDATPGEVHVKYFLAESVSQKGNFTWAGQTFGDHFASDGRPMGEENVTTVTCGQAVPPQIQRMCTIRIPAPGFALVFLSPGALESSHAGGAPPTTFPTTAETRTRNTVTIDQAVLATSNGHSAMGFDGKKGRNGKARLGSTSAGSANDGGDGSKGRLCSSRAVALGMMFGVVGALILSARMVPIA